MEKILKPYLGSSIDRSDKNTLEILKPIVSNYTLFKDISNIFPNVEKKSIENILTNLIFYQFIENQIIFNKGDKINGIYIIFTGMISVYNDEKDEIKIVNIREYEKKFTKRKNIFNSIYDINMLPSSFLNPGDAIGYIPNNSETNYSEKIIQATKESILGYISYNKFYSIIEELKSYDTEQILPFLKSLNLFTNKNNFIEKLKFNTTQRRFLKDSYIFHEGEKFKTFYIIKKGTVNISVKIKKTTKSLIQPELLIGNVNKIRLTGSKENELKGYFKETFDYNLVELCTGETIGDIEYYKNNNSYLYSAKCITPVDILEINMKKFIQLTKKCGDNLSKFHEKINHKIEFFQKRIKDINLTIKQVKIDTNKKDIYTKIFLDNNIRKKNKQNEIFINHAKTPLGKVVEKYKPFKMNKSLSNVVPNYLSVLELKQRCFTAKASKRKRNKNFLYQSFNKKKIMNSRKKLLEIANFKKVNNIFLKRNDDRHQPNNILMKIKERINDITKNKISKLESYEIEKINKNMSELSGIDEIQKNNFISLYMENYKKEHEKRDKILFNKKLKNNFLKENRRNSINNTFKDNRKSFFHLTNPFKTNFLSFNHIY